MPLHLPPELEQRLTQLAAQSGRTPEELAQEGVDRFLTHKEQLIEAVEEGRAAAHRGDLVDHEEVMAMIDDIIENG
jgi:predicted transcriptional regulator